MPKKTKKEKILADLRRKQFLIEMKLRETLKENEKIIPSSYQPKILLNTDNIQSDNQIGSQNKSQDLSTSYVLKDLRKTFILTMLAILFELVLYWWGHF